MKKVLSLIITNKINSSSLLCVVVSGRLGVSFLVTTGVYSGLLSNSRHLFGDLPQLLVLLTRPLVVIRSHLVSALSIISPSLSLGFYQESECFRVL